MKYIGVKLMLQCLLENVPSQLVMTWYNLFFPEKGKDLEVTGVALASGPTFYKEDLKRMQNYYQALDFYRKDPKKKLKTRSTPFPSMNTMRSTLQPPTPTLKTKLVDDGVAKSVVTE
jgi:hypothetical protein